MSDTHKTPKDFAGITKRLDEARESFAGRDAGHLLTVREQIDAIARGDYDGVMRQAHQEVTLEIFGPPEFPFIRQATGLEAVRRAIEHNFTALEDQQPTLANVIAEGDVLVLIGTERGRLRESKAEYSVEFVHRFTFSEGALRSVRIIAART